ncbi:hypothetical protein CAMSH0001_0833 [Campylobacter showae RM3277]|uniref:Uncharacterized protein n=1 Tax=Campylobacter showae RM3277 TaxID=553219 RepID=C6RHK6_9BACT|nr:hypothetical protein CAMSH0001_0833 [Campylobacter showae RM3277]
MRTRTGKICKRFFLQKDKALLNRKGRKFNPPARSNQNAALSR